MFFEQRIYSIRDDKPNAEGRAGMIGAILGAAMGFVQYFLMKRAVAYMLGGSNPGKAAGFFFSKMALLVILLVGCLFISRGDLIASAVAVCVVYIGLALAKLIVGRRTVARGEKDER